MNGHPGAAPAVLRQRLTKSYGRSRSRGIVALDLEVLTGRSSASSAATVPARAPRFAARGPIRPPGQVLVFGRMGIAGITGRGATTDRLRPRRAAPPPDRLTAPSSCETIGRLRGRLDTRRRDELAERLRLDLGRSLRDLSSGNRRKVALLLAFLQEVELLVLDEPTNGLDPLIQHEFLALVRETREAGTTVFLSSHVLSEVQRVADRVAFVREGELVAVEDVAELTGKAVREIEVVFAEPVPPSVFEGVPGVTDVAVDGKKATTLRFTVSGLPSPSSSSWPATRSSTCSAGFPIWKTSS